MRILVVVTGDYGRRHLDNLRRHAPAHWAVEAWYTPAVLPPVLDYPEEYLPESLPPADLILSLAELPGAAELIPELARLSGAQAVIAPIDSQAWLPFGLARQLQGWLAQMGVACVTPMPFCSLTETHAGALRLRAAYDHPLIREFAQRFGRPAFRIEADESGRQIGQVEVVRDACCGCARFVAGKLSGTPLADAVEQAGLHHHHYPCQASMGVDPLYGDTLMHVSGNIMKDAVKEALGDRLTARCIRPAGYVDEQT
mgnify:CR=1 FL=1